MTYAYDDVTYAYDDVTYAYDDVTYAYNILRFHVLELSLGLLTFLIETRLVLCLDVLHLPSRVRHL